MTERVFRMVLGGLLWLALILSTYYEMLMPVYVVVGILLFEGVTNWRVPIIITRIKYGKNYREFLEEPACSTQWFGAFESERMLRFIVAIAVLISLHFVTDLIWFIPWLLVGMLILAGITNICLMVMLLRWVGFR